MNLSNLWDASTVYTTFVSNRTQMYVNVPRYSATVLPFSRLTSTRIDRYIMPTDLGLSDQENTIELGTPLNFTLRGDLDNHWHLVSGLPMSLAISDDEVIVSDHVFSRYGIGDTLKEALRDFIADITSYYEAVELRATDQYPENQVLLRELQLYLIYR